jgi:DNA-directed RNA polymerase II subunit RPB1
MADVLTIPERVTSLNREELEEICAEPVVARASTRSLFSADGTGCRNLRANPFNMKYDGRLVVGSIVERPLRRGDVVLLNRQPTLHGPSMQAVRVIPQRRNTVAFGLSKTSPFNADFDGDEMNIHVPQNLAARAELEQLMPTPSQVQDCNARQITGTHRSNATCMRAKTTAIMEWEANFEHVFARLCCSLPRRIYCR